jgi:hypothetical protein
MQCDNLACPHWLADRPEATRFDDWPPPPLEPGIFREESWRLAGPSNKTVSCVIVLTATGYEVRVGYSDDDILRTTLAPDLSSARAISEAVKSRGHALGSFADLRSVT